MSQSAVTSYIIQRIALPSLHNRLSGTADTCDNHCRQLATCIITDLWCCETPTVDGKK